MKIIHNKNIWKLLMYYFKKPCVEYGSNLFNTGWTCKYPGHKLIMIGRIKYKQLLVELRVVSKS